MFLSLFPFFFFTAPATPQIYTLSLHDALPIFCTPVRATSATSAEREATRAASMPKEPSPLTPRASRSEEHTSELQSRQYLVCRLLLEKKKKKQNKKINSNNNKNT